MSGRQGRPVVIQYPGQSEEYEVASVAVAKKVHPDARIVRYAGTFVPFDDKETQLPPPPAPPASVNPEQES